MTSETTETTANEGDPRPQVSNAPDQAEIARLPIATVSQMTVREMLRVIEASEAPFLDQRPTEGANEPEAPTLEQLVYLARRHCRQNVGEATDS